MGRHNRFTIYDMMETKGFFAANAANPDSRGEDGLSLYKGPVEYPKMFYHPKGEERVIEPARVEPTPVGPVTIPAKTEMISKIVFDKDEEKALRAEGWHDHPAQAMKAAGKEVPMPAAALAQKSKDQEISELKAELEKLNREKQLRELAQTPGPGAAAIVSAPKTGA